MMEKGRGGEMVGYIPIANVSPATEPQSQKEEEGEREKETAAAPSPNGSGAGGWVRHQHQGHGVQGREGVREGSLAGGDIRRRGRVLDELDDASATVVEAEFEGIPHGNWCDSGDDGSVALPGYVGRTHGNTYHDDLQGLR